MSSNLFGSFALRCATFSPRAAELLESARRDAKAWEVEQLRLLDVANPGCEAAAEARDAEAAELAFWLEAAQAAPSKTACKRALRAGGLELVQAIQRLRSEGLPLGGYLANIFPQRAPEPREHEEQGEREERRTEYSERLPEPEPAWAGDDQTATVVDVPPGSAWVAEEVGWLRGGRTRYVVGFVSEEEARAWVSARSARIVRRSAAGYTNYFDSTFSVRPL